MGMILRIDDYPVECYGCSETVASYVVIGCDDASDDNGLCEKCLRKYGAALASMRKAKDAVEDEP